MPCRPSKKPSGPGRFVLPGPNPGLRVRGNIDLFTRPVVRNRGAWSTVFSHGFGTDAGEVLVPRVVGGRVVTELRAEQEYRRTGKHLGIFSSVPALERYADRLHEQQARIYCLLGRSN